MKTLIKFDFHKAIRALDRAIGLRGIILVILLVAPLVLYLRFEGPPDIVTGCGLIVAGLILDAVYLAGTLWISPAFVCRDKARGCRRCRKKSKRWKRRDG